MKLHERLLRGRKLVVTYANAAPVDDGPPGYSRRRADIKPTSLSLLKARKPQRCVFLEAAEESSLLS